jgi:hypothetical protein
MGRLLFGRALEKYLTHPHSATDFVSCGITSVRPFFVPITLVIWNGQGPKDEADLTKFIKEFDPAKLKMMGIDPGDVGKLLVSERDGKPFRVRYGVGGGRGSVSPVVFEQDGKDGKKQVGFTGGKVEDVDDATYKAYLSGKDPGAPPSGGPPMGGRPGSGRPPGAPGGPP